MKSSGIERAANHYEGEIQQLQKAKGELQRVLEETLRRTELSNGEGIL